MNEQRGTIWYRTPEGTLVEQSGIPAPEVPDGCEAVNAADYYDQLSAAEAAEAAAAAAERAAVAQREALVEQALKFYLEHGGQPPVSQ